VRARNARAFPTGNGHVQIEELEARGRFAGNHYFYYCSSIVTHFAEEIPSDFEELQRQKGCSKQAAHRSVNKGLPQSHVPSACGRR